MDPEGGIERRSEARGGARRASRWELVVVALLAVAIGSVVVLSARDRLLPPPPSVPVRFASDPSGATLVIDGVVRGRTPVVVELPEGREIEYRLVAAEPWSAYDLYRPYAGTLVPREGRSVTIWIERTTAEEQEAQRRARSGAP